MTEEVYAEQPATVEIRLVDVQVSEPGFRTKGFTVATTMLDHLQFSRAWIGSVYRGRWLVELDIRSIKCSLGMDIIRAKTPEMVRTEIWTCLLAYNLIRAKILQSSAESGRAAISRFTKIPLDVLKNMKLSVSDPTIAAAQLEWWTGVMKRQDMLQATPDAKALIQK